MRKILLALAATACAFPAGAATVNVLRGTDSATVSTAGGGISVLRGAPSSDIPTAKPDTAGVAARYAVAGGDRLWLIDRRTGRLTACWVGGTSVAGQSRFRCAAGRLR